MTGCHSSKLLLTTIAAGIVSCMPPAVKMKARVVPAAEYGPLVEVYECDRQRILSGEGGMLFDWVRFVAIDAAVPGLTAPLSDASVGEVRLQPGMVMWEIRPKTSEIPWLPVYVYHPKRVAALTYGHPPPGYEQIVPASGAPPPL